MSLLLGSILCAVTGEAVETIQRKLYQRKQRNARRKLCKRW